ncbi:hypothetical protein SUGI_1124720 [Cryptomeria japonica]|nr:hypothetical protein SUGI_1124720 [Cryptomeria japonica]
MAFLWSITNIRMKKVLFSQGDDIIDAIKEVLHKDYVEEAAYYQVSSEVFSTFVQNILLITGDKEMVKTSAKHYIWEKHWKNIDAEVVSANWVLCASLPLRGHEFNDLCFNRYVEGEQGAFSVSSIRVRGSSGVRRWQSQLLQTRNGCHGLACAIQKGCRTRKVQHC